ncbi:MAG: hypothetical protein ABEJ87_02730 [Candidatus Nanohalobium sp.]
MMLSTHILTGGCLGLIYSLFTGDTQALLVFIGMISSVFPDMDFFLDHRKTLHRPLEYSILGLFAAGFYSLSHVNALLLVSLILVSMGLHSFSEIFSEPRSLDGKGSKAVFNHLNGRWMEAQEWTEVGSLRDFLLTCFRAIPLFLVQNIFIRGFTFLMVAYGVVHYLLNELFREKLSDRDLGK